MVTQPDIPAGPEAADPDRPAMAWAPPDQAVTAWHVPDHSAPAWPAPAQGQPVPGQPPPIWSAVSQPVPAYPMPGEAPARHARPMSLRLALTVLAAVLGLAGLTASLTGVVVQVLPRTFSGSQQRQIMSWQIANRWRTWPAGKLFPASVSYQLPPAVLASPSSLTLTARRLGIAPQASCQDAVDAALAHVLASYGCLAVLRATYVDSSGSFVVTVGVAALRDLAPEVSTLPSGQGISPGLMPAAFPGTLSSKFGNPQRQLTHAVSDGSYLIMETTGYVDGRTRDQVSANPYADNEMISVQSNIGVAIAQAIDAAPPVPKCPGAPGC